MGDFIRFSQLTAVLLLSFCNFVISQTPASIQWQKCLGGTDPDYGLGEHIQTSDGGIIFVGSTASNNGDVIGNHGNYDLWVVKLNPSGIIQWQHCLGGSNEDHGIDILQTADGGFIVVGETKSNNGDVIGYHGNWDIWLIKLNSLGVLVWQNCIGGYYADRANDLIQTLDGGFFITGSTNSNDGDILGAGYHGIAGNNPSDLVGIKMDSFGNVEWIKCFGGTNDDVGTSVQQTSDGGYLCSGFSNSTNGDVVGNHGNYDAWIIKVNSTGTLQWQKSLGGSSYDQSHDMHITADGGFVLLGNTASNNGDVNGNNGMGDVWVVKLNPSGIIQWQQCYGGTNSEYGKQILQTMDGSYILAGYTESNDGNVSGNHGSFDMWIVKISSIGGILWQKCLGGTNIDIATCLNQLSDGSYLISGYTESTNGFFQVNHGSSDAWIVKLLECNATTNSFSTLNESSCISYTSPTGQVYTSSGTYTEVIPNYLGCDSTITINLTVHQPQTNNITVNTCSLPYTWNDLLYNAYGNYTQVLQSVNGCDSTVNMTLGYFPSTQNICIVGVDPASGKNKVVWEKEQTQVISSYNVYRENTQSGSFDLIGTNNYSDSSWFLDVNSNPNQQAYRYQIKYVDTCGTESNAGDIHKTMHLTINQGVGTTWNLIWTPYEGISYPSYNIYRGTNANNMTLLTTVASTLSSYTDATAPSGFVYYQIEIVTPNTCNPTKQVYNSSRSNVSTNDPSYLNLSELIENDQLSIYPNPTTDLINIVYDGEIQLVELVDMKGALLYINNENKTEHQLPHSIQTGIYTVLIHTDNGIVRKKLMIK